jgi:hypothetical protein
MQQQKQPCHRLEWLAQLSLERVSTKFQGNVSVPKRLKADAVEAAFHKIIEEAAERGIGWEDQTHDGLLIDIGAGEIANFIGLHENTRNRQFYDVISGDSNQHCDHNPNGYSNEPSNESESVEDRDYDSIYIHPALWGGANEEGELNERILERFDPVGQEIVRLAVTGLGQREIADELRISRHQVRTVLDEAGEIIEEYKRG